MVRIPTCITIFLLLFTKAANAGYWVSSFTDSASQYRIIRESKTSSIEQLMLLQLGDTVIIDDPDGQVVLVNERNEHRILTAGDSPFVVAESGSPSQLLINVRDWVASWWSTRGNQSTSTMAAVSKGGLEPEISGAMSGLNFPLSGPRHLHLVWSGGLPPFDVRLTSESGESMGYLTGVTDYAISFPDVELQSGQHYFFHVASGDSRIVLDVMAVDGEQLPKPAAAILNLDVPDKVRFGYLAMLLSTQWHWRFEALQLAHEFELSRLKLDLLAGDFPESGITELSPIPDLLDTDQH